MVGMAACLPGGCTMSPSICRCHRFTSSSPFLNVNLHFYLYTLLRNLPFTLPDRYLSIMSGKPQPAYIAQPGSILHADQDFYAPIGGTHDDASARREILSFELPIRSGRAWKVKAGNICRISTPHGPQVGDLNIWNLHNPRERFWAARTR